MLISEVIQIRSKLNERIIKLDAILTKLGGKTCITTYLTTKERKNSSESLKKNSTTGLTLSQKKEKICSNITVKTWWKSVEK